MVDFGWNYEILGFSMDARDDEGSIPCFITDVGFRFYMRASMRGGLDSDDYQIHKFTK